ncbi:MAG: hypothetical protein RLZZ628_4043 [Bacteroidota bacterium]|jgi:hypothetical protein
MVKNGASRTHHGRLSYICIQIFLWKLKLQRVAVTKGSSIGVIISQ